MESLAPKTTPNSVREALEHLPRTLSAAYKVTMDRIDQQEMESRDLALAVLTWVTNAKRVLKVVELREALAVKAGAKNLDPDDRPELSIILNVCAGLIIVDKRSSKIRLVHYSTQNYLDGLFPNAQMYITRTLLTYITFDVMQPCSLDETVFMGAWKDLRTWKEQWKIIQKHTQDMEHKHPLIHYCEYCLVHAVGQPEVELSDMILNFLEAAAQWHRRLCLRQLHSPTWGHTLPWDFRWPSSPSSLWVAAAANLLKIAEYLLAHGEVPNDKDKGMSALCVASFKGHIQMVKLLKCASPSWEAGCNCRALRLASQYGHTEIVQFLLESDADVNAEESHSARNHPFSFKGTALQAAITNGHTGIVHLLFDNGAKINLLDKGFPSALSDASRAGCTEIVCRVLEEASKSTATTEYYNTSPLVSKKDFMEGLEQTYGQALTAAASNGHIEICCLLLAKGANINMVNRDYLTSLQLAARNGHIETVCLLLEKGADLNHVHEVNGRALKFASHGGHMEVVRLLLEKGADVNAVKGRDGTALYVASEQGHTQIVRLLLKKGANVNAISRKHGRSSLQAASIKGHWEIFQLLLENGVDIDAVGKYGSALYFASQNGRTEMVRLLLDQGANVNTTCGRQKLSSLQAAAKNAHQEVVLLLLSNGADINAAAKCGTALALASRMGRTEIAGLLIEKGANVNAVGKEGSVLQVASARGHETIVRLLLDHGADVNAVGGKYGSAFKAAVKNGYKEIAQILRQSGAQRK